MDVVLWSVGEVAEYMRLHPDTVRQKFREGGFPSDVAFKTPGGITAPLRFRRDKLIQWYEGEARFEEAGGAP